MDLWPSPELVGMVGGPGCLRNCCKVQSKLPYCPRAIKSLIGAFVDIEEEFLSITLSFLPELLVDCTSQCMRVGFDCFNEQGAWTS